MSTALQTIDGVDVLVDGAGPRTVVMIHGWPDTHRLWDPTVAALADRYRCVRFTLPGFDLSRPTGPLSLADLVGRIKALVDAVSPQAPVTLLLHDWGCVFGYEFAARHPARVSHIVAVDIGDHNTAAFARSLSLRARWQIFSYQVWLAAAWVLGRHVSTALGDRMTRRMTRRMARSLRCPTAPDAIGWPMNYPYAMQWFGLNGGLRSAAPVQPGCPVLYLYGARKPFQFHSPDWLARIAARPGSAAHGLRTGHWVMVEQPEAFNRLVRAWMDLNEPARTHPPR